MRVILAGGKNGKDAALTPAGKVRAFITRIEETIKRHPLWKGDSEDTLDTASEGVERLVMTKIYHQVFAAHPNAEAKDQKLFNRLASLSFLTHEHLDAKKPPSRLKRGWLLAQSALREINDYYSPGDKLECIMNCSRVLSTLLAAASTSSCVCSASFSVSLTVACYGVSLRCPRRQPVGADDFLPALIYTVLHANPPQLSSNLRYIGEFRSPARLMSEQGYWFTNLISAVSFLKTVDAGTLSISREEFEEGVRTAKATAERLRQQTVSSTPPRRCVVVVLCYPHMAFLLGRFRAHFPAVACVSWQPFASPVTLCADRLLYAGGQGPECAAHRTPSGHAWPAIHAPL